MNTQKIKISGLMLATIIVIATLMYTVEIQPVATGDLQTPPPQETGIAANLARYYGILELLLSKSPALFPWTLFKKTPTYTLNTFSSPQELQQFFKKNNANLCLDRLFCYVDCNNNQDFNR